MDSNSKYYYVMLELSSVEACFQEDAYLTPPQTIFGDKIVEVKEIGPLKTSIHFQTNNYFIWGFHDILRLFIFDNIKGFAELQKLNPLNNIYDLKCFAGVYCSDNSIDLDALSSRYPLTGISFLKFKDGFLKHIESDKFCTFIFEEFKKKANINPDDLQIIPIISYGWEDVILLFFSKSYFSIKESILNLRAITLKEIAEFVMPAYPGISQRHVVTDTCTILGVHLPVYVKGEISKSVNILKNNISKEDKAYVNNIRIQVRPGHENHAISMLSSPSCLREEISQKKIKIRAIPHRADIMLDFFVDYNFYEFLEFYIKISGIMRQENTPINSLDTEFVMDESLMVKREVVQVDGPIQSKTIIEDEDIKLMVWLKELSAKKINGNCKTEEKYITEHALLGLVNVILNASFFEKHYFISQTMKSWVISVNALKSELLKNKKIIEGIEQINAENPKMILDLYEEKIQKINFFLEASLPLLQHAFLDRYRGIHPVGELSSIPSLTYNMSLQKLLTSIDYVCNMIYREVAMKFHSPRLNHHFCSFFTTDFSPAVSMFPWNTFVFVPNIFTYEVDYLAHEVGHIFWKNHYGEDLKTLCEIAEEFNKKLYNGKIRCIIQEILCDYFSLCVFLKSDKSLLYKVLNIKRHEENIRINAVVWLYDSLNGENMKTPFESKELAPVNKALKFIVSGNLKLKEALIFIKEETSKFNHYDFSPEGNKWINCFLRFNREIDA